MYCNQSQLGRCIASQSLSHTLLLRHMITAEDVHMGNITALQVLIDCFGLLKLRLESRAWHCKTVAVSMLQACWAVWQCFHHVFGWLPKVFHFAVDSNVCRLTHCAWAACMQHLFCSIRSSPFLQRTALLHKQILCGKAAEKTQACIAYPSLKH